MSFAPETEPLARPEALLRVPVGLASPLWGLFAGAAMTGAAWWWMTRWTRPQNLEALYGAAARFGAVAETPVLEAPAMAAVEVAEAVAETTPAPEAMADAAPETVAEALTEASAAPAPVGGEAAPISPVLEALAPEVVAEPEAPIAKPKKKTAAPPAADKPA